EPFSSLLEVRVASGAREELVERLVHAAVLGRKQLGVVAQRRDTAVQVLAEALRDGQRAVTESAGDVLVDVEQTCENLVQVVIGHDHLVVGCSTALDSIECGVTERSDVTFARGSDRKSVV